MKNLFLLTLLLTLVSKSFSQTSIVHLSNPKYKYITQGHYQIDSTLTVDCIKLKQNGLRSVDGISPVIIQNLTGLTINTNALTGSSSVTSLSVNQSWNTSGSPILYYGNVTYTTAATTAALLDLRINNVRRLTYYANGTSPTFNVGSAIAGTTHSLLIAGSAANNGNLECLNIFGASGSFVIRPNNKLRVYQNSGGNGGLMMLGSNADANTSAVLEINSTTAGFLPPRMTGAQVLAISSPAQGLLVFATSTSGAITSVGWWGYNGSAWEKLNN